jgi:hypothetical protein
VATLVPCLDALRSEFNRNFSRRDKASDGWIGDPAHQASSSDHNPDERGYVHAIDVDEDLRAPGATMRECVEEVVRRHRTGADNRLTYVIYDRTIWSASNDWRPRDYSGSNPHDKHAHFSASYVRARESSRAPFGVEDIVTQADRDDIVNRVVAQLKPLIEKVPTAAENATAVWGRPLVNPYTGANQPAADFQRYAPSKQPTLDVHASVLELAAHEATDDAARAAAIAETQASVNAMREQLATHAEGDGEPSTPPAG